MHRSGDQIRLSATDLANHLACRHLTGLNKAAAEGRLAVPIRNDPRLDALKQRGFGHERAYLDHLRSQGRTILELPEDDDPQTAVERTRDAMRSGADVIVQATLGEDRWLGRADVLLRVERPSNLGAFSYEAVDTKLARETQAGTILQLCVYTDAVRAIQGALPESMHVVTPGIGFVPETYRTADFMAYYRLVRDRLLTAVETGDGGLGATYPEPVPHCEVCRWWADCRDRRRRDDHLSLAAGITGLQRSELETRGIATLEALGDARLPFPWRPSRGSPDGYTRVREQARVQLAGRRTGRNLYELLEVGPGLGLTRLPEPSDGDVFFDIEGDPFVPPDGLEYLLGWVADGRYRHLWALDREAERRAFESFVDQVMARWKAYTDLHVYHYAPYEPSALKRLMGRYATREDEVDRMLRAGLFVDLYAVVRQALRASVERYSIKDLEVFFGYVRHADLRGASAALSAVEVALELGDAAGVDRAAMEQVRVYNADDCHAARGLRDWLERLRDEAIAAGSDVARPEPEPGDAPESVDAWLEQIGPVRKALLDGVSTDARERPGVEDARWVLAHSLEFYRREDKVRWWTWFRLRDLSEDELLDETAAVAGLRFTERVGLRKQVPLDRYGFPPQNTNLRSGDKLTLPDGSAFGKVEDIDLAARTLDIRKPKALAETHPTAVFSCEVVSGRHKAPSLLRVAEWAVAHGMEADGPYRAARALLLRHPPRFSDGRRLPAGGDEDLVQTACELGRRLEASTLAIQGPPGSGKTYTAAQMAVALLREGRNVGVTAVSHKVIRNLLKWIVRIAADEGVDARCLQKVGERGLEAAAEIDETPDNDTVVAALASGAANVVGGTTWLWAREAMDGAVDVLFVDEAGQLSLTDAIAASRSAKSMVLLGDPCQLDQPLEGSHPEGTAVSALGHLLEGRRTMPPERGLFMSKTRRLAPAICEFTSELFYDGRLGTIPGLERQRLEGGGPVAGAGLWFAPTPHTGNQSASPEEVRRIEALFRQLTRGATRWVDEAGRRHALTPDDVLVVAPYNAQVSDLKRALPEARVGTVDKFQGQEAPVVIYSMTTSSREDAPRGMEFLYSLNRLNVATSRARCACILVANPRVFEPECRTPAEMRLANAFCRYLEMAREV